MRTTWHWLLVLALAAPAWAQDETAPAEPAEPAEAVPAEDPAAAEETAPAEDAAAAEAPTEEAPLEEIPVEEVAAEDGGSGGGEPWVLYAGADLVTAYLAPQTSAGAGVPELESGLYRVHFGARPFEALNIEVQAGIHEGSYGPGEYRTESYIGAFVVPHIDAMWIFDVAFPVGFANTAVKPSAAVKKNLHSVAYGFELALPIRNFSENLPDLRFTTGGMMYYQKADAQIYGFHFGLNYAFGG